MKCGPERQDNSGFIIKEYFHAIRQNADMKGRLGICEAEMVELKRYKSEGEELQKHCQERDTHIAALTGKLDQQTTELLDAQHKMEEIVVKYG